MASFSAAIAAFRSSAHVVRRPPQALEVILRNSKQPMRLFTEAELRQRLGSLDVDSVATEITMSTNELDEHMEAQPVTACAIRTPEVSASFAPCPSPPAWRRRMTRPLSSSCTSKRVR